MLMLMQKGSSGYAVESLQKMLTGLGFYHEGISGSFDAATEKAVCAFQEKNLLLPTGIADERTLLIVAMRAAAADQPAAELFPENAAAGTGAAAAGTEAAAAETGATAGAPSREAKQKENPERSGAARRKR